MHNEVKEGVFKKINSNNISLYRLDCIFQFTEKVTSGGAQSVEDPRVLKDLKNEDLRPKIIICHRALLLVQHYIVNNNGQKPCNPV